MSYILTWVSLVFVSLSLIFLDRWVKKEVQIYALVVLVIVEVTLIVALSTLK